MGVRQHFEGSCVCGQVRYRAVGPLGEMVHCHCTDCRKRHGAAFATHVGIPRERFRLLQGGDLIQKYRTASGTRRWFCRKCGSKIASDSEAWEEVYFTAGTLDTPLERAKQLHIFVRSKVRWHEIRDMYPQHSTFPPSWT